MFSDCTLGGSVVIENTVEMKSDFDIAFSVGLCNVLQMKHVPYFNVIIFVVSLFLL